MGLSESFHFSGGWLYHARSLRFRERLWTPFRKSLSDRLLSWRERTGGDARPLLLIGPSGFHCLPERLVGAGTRLHVSEPDPIARWILKRRLKRSPLFLTDDLLQPLDIQSFKKKLMVLDGSERVAIVFCNLLGQTALSFQETETRKKQWQNFAPALLKALEERGSPVFSFHDRLSFESSFRHAPELDAQSWVRQWPSSPSDDVLLEAVRVEVLPRLLPKTGVTTVKTVVHATSDLTKGRSTETHTWWLTPKRLHVIEFVETNT